MAMAVLVVTEVRERKSGGYNGGYYWDRGRDVFPGEGYDFSPFVTERDPWECAKRCVGHQRCPHFHKEFDNNIPLLSQKQYRIQTGRVQVFRGYLRMDSWSIQLRPPSHRQ